MGGQYLVVIIYVLLLTALACQLLTYGGWSSFGVIKAHSTYELLEVHRIGLDGVIPIIVCWQMRT